MLLITRPLGLILARKLPAAAARYSLDLAASWLGVHGAHPTLRLSLIPARFAPNVAFSWRGRGENAIKQRRDELRKVAMTRIAAIEKAACTKIEMSCLDAQSQILAHGPVVSRLRRRVGRLRAPRRKKGAAEES